MSHPAYELTPPEILRKLIDNRDKDWEEKPVVKIFFPMGSATWLLISITDDTPGEEIAYGLADLGFGSPEIGYVSLKELRELRFSLLPGGPGTLRLERDLYFEPTHSLQAYTLAAWANCHIVEDPKLIEQALNAEEVA